MKEIILIRGLGRHSGHWGDFPQQLEHALRGAGLKVLVSCVDLPGFGKEAQQPPPLSIADSLLRMQKSVSAKKGVIIVAMSFACLHALEWLRDQRQEIGGIVLINGSFPPNSKMYERLRPRAATALIRILFARDAQIREALILKLVSSQKLNGSDALLSTHRLWTALEEQQRTKSSHVLRQLAAAALHRVKALPPATAPILLIASKKDRMVNPECSRRFARLKHLPLIEHPDAGHDVALDDGAWLIRTIREFVSNPAQSQFAPQTTREAL